ncbi:S41 family peptidase [Olivibacter domesticus]|uniref:Peptidase family S41 n=1 Tax=Olivibacter domesticus TaxID=407022 RepID=A0A1H7GGC1_OLID1|nr:S41 family peptidase [Olivibacter domesticus]SEK37124.1 Peptidase family S41 [Olivibacter domesticus]
MSLLMKQKPRFFLLLVLFLSVIVCYSQEIGIDHQRLGQLRTEFENGKMEISNYNTACYFALSGDRTLAFVYLKKAVYDDGFADATAMEKDPDLSTLHHDALWPVILQKIEENVMKQQKVAALYFNQKDFWESKTLKTPYRENISEEEKIAGLSKFWSEAKYNFANFDLLPDLNFDSLYFAYLSKVTNTKSTLEYYQLMAKFGAMLRDGHTNVYAPQELTNELYARPLLRSRLVEGKTLIVGVYDPKLEKEGIKVGQEIVEVNGLPVKEYAARYVIPYESSSTRQDKEVRAYDYALLAGSIHQPIALQLKDKSGFMQKYSISRVKPEERSAKLAAAPFEYKMLKGNIAYIALNSFGSDSAANAFAACYENISKANAIIFDIRNNGGGSSSVGWNILSYLIQKPFPIHSWYTREYRPSFRAWNNIQQVYGGKSKLYPKEKFFYHKPVVVLTSARTFSAAEDFAAAFKSLHRGQIIGSATGGSSGQPLVISLPGNGTARICTKRDMLANGEDFVGKGVQPDKKVVPTIEDVRKGVDTVLEEAIKQLLSPKHGANKI